VRAALARAWAALNEPRESGGFWAWSCPGEGCDGFFPTPAKARDHAAIAQVTGSHETGPQRRARRARGRAARQLRGQARRAGRQR
jgi:hypothetical protein